MKCSSWDKMPDHSLYVDGFTQSMMSVAVTCPRKLWFFLNKLYNPVNQGNYAFGSFMHKMLEKMYTGVIKNSEDVYAYVDAVETRDPKLLPLASALGRAYIEHFAKEIKQSAGVCEKPFAHTVKTDIDILDRIHVRGQRDMYFKKKKEVWLMEHKFWGQINPDELLNTLPFDFQVNFYAWTYAQEHGELPAGIIYNICRKPQNKMKENGDPVEFEERVYQAIKEKPEYYFHRIPITVTKKGMARFEKDLIGKIERVNAMLVEPIYRNEFACFADYACEYHSACFSENISLLKQHEILFNELEEKTDGATA